MKIKEILKLLVIIALVSVSVWLWCALSTAFLDWVFDTFEFEQILMGISGFFGIVIGVPIYKCKKMTEHCRKE